MTHPLDDHQEEVYEQHKPVSEQELAEFEEINKAGREAIKSIFDLIITPDRVSNQQTNWLSCKLCDALIPLCGQIVEVNCNIDKKITMIRLAIFNFGVQLYNMILSQEDDFEKQYEEHFMQLELTYIVQQLIDDQLKSVDDHLKPVDYEEIFEAGREACSSIYDLMTTEGCFTHQQAYWLSRKLLDSLKPLCDQITVINCNIERKIAMIRLALSKISVAVCNEIMMQQYDPSKQFEEPLKNLDLTNLVQQIAGPGFSSVSSAYRDHLIVDQYKPVDEQQEHIDEQQIPTSQVHLMNTKYTKPSFLVMMRDILVTCTCY